MKSPSADLFHVEHSLDPNDMELLTGPLPVTLCRVGIDTSHPLQ
jgi:hypothetical protein